MPDVTEKRTEKVLVSLYAEDVERLGRLAANVVEPGARPNQSLAIREGLRLLEKKIRKPSR